SLVPTSRTLTAGDGLTGGGNLSANRTFNVGGSSSITVSADSIAVNPAGVSHNSLADLTTGDPHTMYVNREANGTVADNRLVRWDTTSGRDLQQSAATEDDSGNVTGWTSVSVSGKVRANQVEIQETGAGGTNQQLWEVVNTTGGVFTIRTRTNADGGGNDALQLERNGTLVSRCQAVTQYGLTEIADSYLVEVDTAS